MTEESCHLEVIHCTPGARFQRWLQRPRSSHITRVLSVPVEAYFGRRLRRRSAESPAVPTVVVGDLGFGGVGKTAVVSYLAQAMAPHAQVAIVGHGYGARLREPGKVARADARAYGDEAAALFRELGGTCSVWVGADRATTIQMAGREADVVIVDRGLGDPTVARTVDLVVLDDEGGTGVFPAGPLRASVDALGGEQWVWTHHVTPEKEGQVEGIGSRYRVQRIELPSGEQSAPEELAGCAVVTLCGVANPRSFYRGVLETGARIVGGLEVGDHRPFPRHALARLPKDALWITTAKDRERLPAEWPAAVMHVELELVSGQDHLAALYDRLLGS